MKMPATAVWQGFLSDGNEALTSESYVLNSAPVSSLARVQATCAVIENPGKLLTATLTACFSRVLADAFSDTDGIPEVLNISAEVRLDDFFVCGWTITSSYLALEAKVSEMKNANTSG